MTCCLAVTTPLLFAAGGGAQQDRGETIFAQTVAETARMQSLSADIEVIHRAGSGGGGSEDRRTGHVLLLKPDKARITLAGKNGANPLTIVAGGSAIFFSNQKLYTKEILKSGSGAASAIGAACDSALLTFFYQPKMQSLAPGLGPVGKVTYKGQVKIGTELCDTLTASGTRPSAFTITLTVGPDHLPRRASLQLQIAAKYAEVYEVRLSRLTLNPKIAPALFRFDPPLGSVEFVPPDREPEKKSRP